MNFLIFRFLIWIFKFFMFFLSFMSFYDVLLLFKFFIMILITYFIFMCMMLQCEHKNIDDFKTLRILNHHVIQQLSGFGMITWYIFFIPREPIHHIIRITCYKWSLYWFRPENMFFTVLTMINYMKIESLAVGAPRRI